MLVLCTDGSKGSDDPEMTAERLAATRAEEQKESARILGLKDVVFLGYPDSYLEPTLQLRKDIAREIRRHRPDIVITEPPTRDIDSRYYGSHPDHLATGEAALAAVFPTARDRLTFPELLEEGLEPHKVRRGLDSRRAGRLGPFHRRGRLPGHGHRRPQVPQVATGPGGRGEVLSHGPSRHR